jgi:arylsulfatase A-like enzyme
MKWTREINLAFAVAAMLLSVAATPAARAQEKKPNIVFIMGDDIGWMQPSIYHRGLMVGETPNIDRIGNEGAIFMTYYAEQSCTAGRNSFFTGMHPLRTGMIPPQLPGSPSYLRPGTPVSDRLASPFVPRRTVTFTNFIRFAVGRLFDFS